MKLVNKIENSISVIIAGSLPNNDNIVVVKCEDYDFYKKLPAGIEYGEKLYGLTGWNSDNCEAYYKSSKKFAMAI